MAEQAENGKVEYTSGWERYKKRRKITRIVLVSVAFGLALIALFLFVFVPMLRYHAAVRLFNEGRYEEAIFAFDALHGYKDSRMRISNCYMNLYGMELYKQIMRLQAGETFSFGTYEQDNDLSNGEEPIEWMVLAKDETMLLVISKYALDCRQYHNADDDITWETCSIREWLNDSFYNSAFSRLEQRAIVPVTVMPDADAVGRVGQEKETTDRVFLLSVSEAYRYFGDPYAVETQEKRICQPTPYAAAHGCVTDEYGSCWWWLRSSGFLPNYAARVNMAGAVYAYGFSIFNDMGTIRPAMWINFGVTLDS